MRPRRVIVGVSGSIGSLAALRGAVDEVRRSPGDHLHAVLAWAPPGGEMSAGSAAPPQLTQAWEHAAARRLRTAFDDALGGVPDDIPVHLAIVRGRPGHVLVEFAEVDDLLVVGAHQHGLVRRALVGSITHHCLAKASCPVLVVPAPELLRESGTVRRMARIAHWHSTAPFPW